MPELAEMKKSAGGDGSTLAAVLEKKQENIPHEVLEEENLAGSRVRFKLKVAEKDFAPRMEETFKDFAKQAHVEGFRPGKAPVALVRKRYEAAAREETVKRMIPRLTELFVASRGHEPLTQPYLLDFASTKAEGTTVELAIEVHPRIEISDAILEGLSADIHQVRIDDDVVAKSLENLRVKNATFEPTEDGYQAFDGLLVNCTVSDKDGHVIKDRTVEKYYSTRVEEEMPEAVAKALVGKKKGERVVMDVSEPLEGVPGVIDTVHYNVEVLEVKRRSLPALTDEFAQDVSDQFQTLDDLKKATVDGLKRNEELRERDEALMRIYNTLRERLTFDLPRALVEQTTNSSIREMEGRLNQYGFSLREMDRDIVGRYAQSVQEQARVNVKNGLINRALGKHFAIEPTEENIKEALEALAKQSGRKPLAVRANLEARGQWGQFVGDLRLKLTNDRLMEKAAISKREVSAAEFETIARQAQEEQAARLRGEG